MRNWKRMGLAGLASAAVIGAACGVGAEPGNGAARETPDRGTEPANLGEIAKQLPPIARGADGTVVLPPAVEGPLAWRGIREGVNVEVKGAGDGEGERSRGVGVAYTRTRQKPAGAALAIRPGTLEGLTSLSVRLRGTRTQHLYICLKDTAGVVWTFPAVHVRADEAAERTLRVAEIEPDAFQNTGKVTAKFDPAKVMLVTVLDIGGFMSLDEPACAWTIEEMKGVCK